MYILSIASRLDGFNKVVNSFVDKFTSNPAFAGIIALVLFIFIYIGVSTFTRK